MSGPSKNTHRLRSSAHVVTSVEGDTCHACEDLCWTVEVWARDLLGSGARACLYYREHMQTQGVALLTLARWLMAEGHRVREQDLEQIRLETWPTLF